MSYPNFLSIRAAIAVVTMFLIASAMVLSGHSAAHAVDGVPAPVDLSGFVQDTSVPQITVVDSGDAPAHEYSADSSSSVQANVELTGGASSTPVDLSSVGQDASAPQVAVVACADATARYRDDGSSNGQASVKLCTAGHEAQYSQIALVTTGDATARWYRNDGSKNSIQASVKLAGGAWSTPVEGSAIGHGAKYPQIALAVTGYATAFWNHNGGHSFTVRMSTRQSSLTTTPTANRSASRWAGLANTGLDLQPMVSVGGVGPITVLLGTVAILIVRRRTAAMK